ARASSCHAAKRSSLPPSAARMSASWPAGADAQIVRASKPLSTPPPNPRSTPPDQPDGHVPIVGEQRRPLLAPRREVAKGGAGLHLRELVHEHRPAHVAGAQICERRAARRRAQQAVEAARACLERLLPPLDELG